MSVNKKMVDGQAGKGSNYRPVDQKKYNENWDKAFNKTKSESKKKKRKKRKLKNE
ncbi:MAG: hypothetical protein H8D80_02110 [Proteobacteria bacterium]|nr:hypothetical protein [Pseudomonadota bacterium]